MTLIGKQPFEVLQQRCRRCKLMQDIQTKNRAEARRTEGQIVQICLQQDDVLSHAAGGLQQTSTRASQHCQRLIERDDLPIRFQISRCREEHRPTTLIQELPIM